MVSVPCCLSCRDCGNDPVPMRHHVSHGAAPWLGPVELPFSSTSAMRSENTRMLAIRDLFIAWLLPFLAAPWRLVPLFRTPPARRSSSHTAPARSRHWWSNANVTFASSCFSLLFSGFSAAPAVADRYRQLHRVLLEDQLQPESLSRNVSFGFRHRCVVLLTSPHVHGVCRDMKKATNVTASTSRSSAALSRNSVASVFTKRWITSV